MAMIEGPGAIDISEYSRKRPERLDEEMLDEVSIYAVFLCVELTAHGKEGTGAIKLTARTKIASPDPGQPHVELLLLDDDFNVKKAANGTMNNGLWIPDPNYPLKFLLPFKSRTTEGFFHHYDDGIDLTYLTQPAAKELAAI